MRRTTYLILVAGTLVVTAACSDDIGPRILENTVGVIVSAPVSAPFGAAGATGRPPAASVAGPQLVYVSLPPASVPTAVRAVITNQAVGLSITTPVVNGGFDPVAIVARVGDTLAIDITSAVSAVLAHVRLAVSSVRPLKVVRTSPPSGGRDLPLNTTIVVVFSEPIDAATLTSGAVQLLQDTTPVPGTAQFADSTDLRVEFQPAAVLAAQTSYRLVVTRALRDMNGVAVDSTVAVSFTTGSYVQPTLTTIAPTSAAPGGPAFTLTVNGTEFVRASTVNFGGTALATTFVNDTQLTAAVPASAIATAGSVAVTVTNPSPGGGTSNTVSFFIGTPAPLSLSATSVDFGYQALGTNSATRAVTITNTSSFAEPAQNLRMTGTNWTDFFIRTNDCGELAPGAGCTVTIDFAPGGIGFMQGLLHINFDSPQEQGVSLLGTGTGGVSVAVARARSGKFGGFVYVTNAGSGSVSMYSVDPATGTLTPLAPPRIDAGSQPVSVAVDPSGRFVYVANSGSDNVSMFAIDTNTGALSSIGSPVAAGSGPLSVVVAPDSTGLFGKFAYVMNSNWSSGVSEYAIDTTSGALTPIGSLRAAGPLAVHPSGKFAYAAVGGGFVMYTINATTGALTQVGGVVQAGIGAPTSIAADPSGTSLAVTNQFEIFGMFPVNAATGTLTATFGVASTSGYFTAVAIDPSGRFAYATTSGYPSPPCTGPGPGCSAVWMYSIDANENLTSQGTIAAGSLPTSIAIDPSGRFAYVGNTGSQNISMYSIGTDGTLTLIGTIGM